MICFYHSADLDGHCSGALIKTAFPDCKMIGIDYGQLFPWDKVVSGELVYMVDFSLQPFSDMCKLEDKCTLTWIDHHRTAIDEYYSAVAKGVRFEQPPFLDTNYAACELVWQHLDKTAALSEMPEAVYLLGRYDIWKHKDVTGALEFQYGMRAFADTRPEAPIWADLFAGKYIDKVINDGVTLLQYERNQNAKFIQAYGFDVEFEGLKCIAANRGMSNSLLFDSVWSHDKYDAMLMFAWKNGSFTVSIYTDKPGIDGSVIAKKYGGGGHVGASGFQCAELPW